jgi:hypothetical protein
MYGTHGCWKCVQLWSTFFFYIYNSNYRSQSLFNYVSTIQFLKLSVIPYWMFWLPQIMTFIWYIVTAFRATNAQLHSFCTNFRRTKWGQYERLVDKQKSLSFMQIMTLTISSPWKIYSSGSYPVIKSFYRHIYITLRGLAISFFSGSNSLSRYNVKYRLRLGNEPYISWTMWFYCSSYEHADSVLCRQCCPKLRITATKLWSVEKQKSLIFRWNTSHVCPFTGSVMLVSVTRIIDSVKYSDI